MFMILILSSLTTFYYGFLNIVYTSETIEPQTSYIIWCCIKIFQWKNLNDTDQYAGMEPALRMQ